MSNGSPSFALVEHAWFAIRDNYDRLRQSSSDEQQLATLAADRRRAETAYFAALDKAFDESSEAVKKAGGDLRAVSDRLDADLQNLQDVVSTLKLISSVVSLVTSLVSLAA
jgi:hypothetical protein